MVTGTDLRTEGNENAVEGLYGDFRTFDIATGR